MSLAVGQCGAYSARPSKPPKPLLGLLKVLRKSKSAFLRCDDVAFKRPSYLPDEQRLLLALNLSTICLGIRAIQAAVGAMHEYESVSSSAAPEPNSACSTAAGFGRDASPERDAKGRFLTGNSGGGRPKGSRNKLAEAFVSAIAEDFEEHGAEVITRVRLEDPVAYLRIIGALTYRLVEKKPTIEGAIYPVMVVRDFGDLEEWEAKAIQQQQALLAMHRRDG